MSYVKSNKTDTLVVPIKKAFYFLLESIIKDIVEIVKSKCIDESRYTFIELRNYVDGLSDGVKDRLLKTTAKCYFNNRIFAEMFNEFTSTKRKLNLLNSLNAAVESQSESGSEPNTKVKQTQPSEYYSLIIKLTEHFIELCRFHIWDVINNSPKSTDAHRQFPSLDCVCSVEVAGEMRIIDTGDNRALMSLIVEDEEVSKKYLNDFNSCINNCKCVDSSSSNILVSSDQDDKNSDGGYYC